MRKRIPFICLLVCFSIASPGFSQSLHGGLGTRRPIDLNQIKSFLKEPVATKHFSSSRLSASTKAAAQNASSSVLKIKSLPIFNGSFTFQNQVYPYVMVGASPQRGGTTRIGTSYLAISFVFDEFVDANGNNIVIDATQNTQTILNGPDFERFPYTSGNTQFGDAVQRAEFFGVLKGPHDDSSDSSWHTLLENPRQFTPVTVEVPIGSALVFSDGGVVAALIDINFMLSQLNTLTQTEDIRVDEIPLFVSRNAVFGNVTTGDCCIGGFHTAFETKLVNNTIFVQTLVFATSLDPAVAYFVFGDPTAFADVAPLSHEISETLNDPFGSNIVPAYQSPGLPPGACSAVLETGDPVENLPDRTFPIVVDGFLYHPQTEALLQWFSRQSPSSAIGGAYSYPGNNLTSPSQPCPK